MSMTDTGQQTDIEILEFLDWEPGEPCAYGGCEKDATHKITCGECGVGTESICLEHAEEFILTPNMVLIFDKTCGHTVPTGACEITPL